MKRKYLNYINSIIILYLIFVFSSFYKNFPNINYNDHLIYIAHKSYFLENLDWIKFSISYSRDRILYPGDFILFRPLHMLILALFEINNNINVNFVKIIFLSLNIITASIICQKLFFERNKSLDIAKVFISILIILTALTKIGMEAYNWFHIAPYLLGNSILLLFYVNVINTKKNNVLFIFLNYILLLLAFCISELFALNIIIIFIYLCFINKFSNKFININSIKISCLFSLITWVVLNLIDYYYINYKYIENIKYSWPIFFDYSNLLDIEIVINFFKFIGMFLYKIFLIINYQYISEINYTSEIINDQILTIIGILFISFLSILFIKNNNLSFKNNTSKQISFLISNFLIINIIILLISLYFFRIIPRGFDYLKHSTYYYWYFNFYLNILFIIEIMHNSKILHKYKLILLSILLLIGFLSHKIFLINEINNESEKVLEINQSTKLTKEFYNKNYPGSDSNYLKGINLFDFNLDTFAEFKSPSGNNFSISIELPIQFKIKKIKTLMIYAGPKNDDSEQRYFKNVSITYLNNKIVCNTEFKKINYFNDSWYYLDLSKIKNVNSIESININSKTNIIRIHEITPDLNYIKEAFMINQLNKKIIKFENSYCN